MLGPGCTERYSPASISDIFDKEIGQTVGPFCRDGPRFVRVVSTFDAIGFMQPGSANLAYNDTPCPTEVGHAV